METTRFAPSPTGWLHLGHAYAAWFAAERGQRFLLRIEDIETDRVRPIYREAIFGDLAWLGLQWEEPVWVQSERLPRYRGALDRLIEMGVVYRCICSRKEIAAAVSAPHGEPPIYPGICREQNWGDEDPRPFAWRLDVSKALAMTGPLTWSDHRLGAFPVAPKGDPVLARKDIPTSYHLSATVDDAELGVTLVTRGEDLASSTPIHRILQALLGFPEPRYHHHPLVGDADGNRLSKRDGGIAIRALREAGWSPERLVETARRQLLVR